MGRWGDFADIVNREWPDRQKGDSRHLLQLAQLAANVDQHQAMELTREAVRKAIQDPGFSRAPAHSQFDSDKMKKPFPGSANLVVSRHRIEVPSKLQECVN